MENVSNVEPKAYYILREDLEYSSSRLFMIALNNTTNTANSSNVEIRMMFNLQLVYDLEEKLIQDGVLFTWIEDSDEDSIGIIIHSTEIDIISDYISDCMTLENYAKFRLKYFNELTSNKDKNHPEYYLN